MSRAVGLDAHLESCEVAICEAGKVRSVGRVPSTPEGLRTLVDSLLDSDRVVLEMTRSAWEIVRILEPHVAGVLVVSPGDTGIAHARAKTDRLDARTLAKLLWAGDLDPIWMPDERTRVLRRRLSRREQLVRSRSRAKNEVHAVLMRRLVGRCPFTDMFGKAGRNWLRGLELPVQECETVEAAMRQIEFLDAEVAEVQRLIARDILWSADTRILLSVPGVNLICAATFLAAIGDIRRFSSSRKLVAYLGLDPKVRQSGSELRKLELIAGAKRRDPSAAGIYANYEAMRQAERQLAEQAEASYTRMVGDWQAAAPRKAGASATPERAYR
jgi:transposase